MILGRIARTTMTTTGANTMARTLARAMAAGVVAGAVLSACQGQGSATRPPPTIATPTAITATTGETTGPRTGGATPTDSTEIPAAARANTAAGAEAFARFYFQRVNDGFQAPTSAAIAALASRQCESCHMLEENIHGLAIDRERVAEPPFALGPVVELPISTTAARVFSTTLVHAESRILDIHGLTVRTEPPEKRGIRLLVRATPNGWTMGDIGQES